MHFPLLACLVTVPGLVSVACAAPNLKGRPQTYTLIFLNQNNLISSLVGSLAESHVGSDTLGLPEKFKDFFHNPDIHEGLGYTQDASRTNWMVSAVDNTYEAHINTRLPVYAQFKGGQKCQHRHKCIAMVVDGSLGMISTSSSLIAQIGNPAIVSFTNWGTKGGSSEEAVDMVGLTQNKVHWLLNQDEVMKALGFKDKPDIVPVDKPLSGPENQPTLNFQVYGGTKCLPGRPCEVSIVHTMAPGPLGTYTVNIHIWDHQKKTILYDLVTDFKWTPKWTPK